MDSQTALPTIGELLAALGVETTPVFPETPGAPVVAVDTPEEWEEVAREYLPACYRAWALPAFEDATGPEAQWADNVVIMAWRLSRPVDSTAVMRCAYTDSRRLPQWCELGGQAREHGGFPSAAIRGTYAHGELTLWCSTRYVVVDTLDGQHLVQLTVTTLADENDDGRYIADSVSVRASYAGPELPDTGFEQEIDVSEAGGTAFRI
ncbi:LpqN/LpqT family lipoprotein [Nocardia alni]|uniref:LpqN/LpqT family lipoprotein n=1 Tax=Nocardia alni TaxID=2815723 RepID=UPI001C23E6AC|nr:LpqN/LpqT family lipoprotein [Nocardia alni]